MNTEMNTETIKQQLQATLENKTADGRDAVRQITLKALSGGELDTAALAQLGDAIAGTTETQLETGTQTLRAGGSLPARRASGMLAGIAEGLQSASGGGNRQEIAGQQRLRLWQALTTKRALARLHNIASILICCGFGHMVRRMGLAATLCLVALPAAAVPAWLIATPDETARAGAPIVLDVVKPPAQADWPGSVRLKLVRDGKTLEIPLAPVEPVSAEDTRRAYRGALPAHLSGLVRADLAGVESNRLALLVSTPDAIEQMQSPVEGAMTPATKPGGSGSRLFPVNEPALSANEPMYFVIGSRSTARFQLSFKYQLFDPDSWPVEKFAPLAGLHFGYTQTSLWDLGADSAPFRDTSYRPSLFWQGATAGKGLMPDLLRAGYEHESNGKDGANSRSIDTLFAQPVWRTEFADGRALIFAPKVYAYLEKSDNPDIQRYRGYANWNIRYGLEDSWLLTTQLRSGTSGHGSAQLDLSWPLRRPLFTRTGGFLHLQLFKGYGESLLDYNLNRGTQVRVGFSIVR